MTISFPSNWFSIIANSIYLAAKRFCWNLHTCIWKGSLINAALEKITFQVTPTDEEKAQKVNEIFNACHFGGTWGSEEKKKIIRIKLEEKIKEEDFLENFIPEDPIPVSTAPPSPAISVKSSTDVSQISSSPSILDEPEEKSPRITKTVFEYTGIQQSKGMMRSILMCIFTNTEAFDIGRVITDNLIPPNFSSFKATNITTNGSNTPQKAEFVICLTEDKTTNLPESGINYLAGDGWGSWLAKQTLSLLSINASKIIIGSVDYENKIISFAPGHINGKMPGIAEKTLLTIEYHPNRECLTVTLAEKENLSNTIQQVWTTNDFLKTFSELTWPSNSRTEDQKETIRSAAASLRQ